MILALPPTPSAVCAQATGQSRGDVGMALSKLIDFALARPDFEDRGAEIYRRVDAALGVAAASPEALSRTLDLLNLLPPSVPLPDVVVESDSEIGLDWDEGVRRVVSLTVRNNQMVGYAALFGAEPMYGRTPFAGAIPQTIGFLLARLYPRRHNR